MDRTRPSRRIRRANGKSLLKEQVSAGTIVIVGVGAKHAAQMCRTDNDQMIQTQLEQ